MEYPKTSCKLSKTITQTKKVGSEKNSNHPLYCETNESENFLNKKNVKMTKWSHADRGYASTYNVGILNSFNPELQLKDLYTKIN